MPFIELPKKPLTEFVRVKTTEIVISKDLVREFFEGAGWKHVQIFLDSPNHLVGLKPSDEGYKLSKNGGGISFCCAQLSRTVNGEFRPVWSRKHKMLLIKFS